MNRLILHKDENCIIYGGIITKIEDICIKGKNTYIVTLSGTKVIKENDKFITKKDFVKIYFSNASDSAYRTTQLYDRIKKTGIKLEQYLIVKAESSKKYENIAFAKDFNYINHTFTLPATEKKKSETNLIVGMVKEVKDYASCVKVTTVQKIFQEGKSQTIWPVATFFKDSNGKMANTALKLLKPDEKGKKYAAFTCGPNKPYKGNPCYVANTFELINMVELKKSCCECSLL